jgi:abequosyltransferase
VHSSPLLSISIPTYNRMKYLERLLTILYDEQSANDPRVELIVSDNVSTDGTRAVVEDFIRRGMKLRYVCNEINRGGDDNFCRCYSRMRGKYVWIVGDDDVIAPGALQKILSLLEASEYDLLFLAPYQFPAAGDQFLPRRRLKPDVLKVTTSSLRLVDLIDTYSDFIFITAVIINKERANIQVDLASYVDGNIVQMAWILSVLKNLRRGMFVDAQWVGMGTFNAAGDYDGSHFYGSRFKKALNCWLEPDSPLAKKLTNNHLTMWAFVWLEWKWHSTSKVKIAVADAHRNLLPVYGRNPRYWLCVYPLIVLPEFLARVWAVPWLVRRKLLRLWYQAITPSLKLEAPRNREAPVYTETPGKIAKGK